MVLDASGLISDSLRLEDRASKGTSGRVVPMSSDLRNALEAWRSQQAAGQRFVISTERSSRTSSQAIVNMFFRWYSDLGFMGCSSHSGRRTFITNAARKISTVGGSIRDVQMLAGHSDLRTTQRYIEANADAQRRVVELI
jgi:integrase/recombinase XerD